jgi:integrase
MTAHHELMGGKLHVYKRENSRHWQCSTYLAGRNRRVSTKEESLQHAKDFAEDWFLELKGKARIGELKTPKGGKTFEFAADQFMREFEALTDGERSPIYIEGHRNRLRVHLKPFFGKTALAEITPGVVQEYRIHRMTSRKHPKTGEPMRPARNTLHQEIVCLRQVLKTANRHGWLPYLPNLAAPFRASGKISHRGWFSPTEYKQLYEATRRRAANPPKKRWKWSCEQLRDYVLFMANTGLRPDESARLEFRDVEIVDDDASGERILVIEVRGKRGVGFCKSMPGAVLPFERLRDRLRAKDETGHAEGRRSVASDALGQVAGQKRKPIERSKPKPNDRLFPQTHRELFNLILEEEELKEDRDGQRRTAYSLRHTYICMRLMEGADIYQIAKNCRTSVEMIEKYYASHLKNTLDAAAINVRKPRSSKRKPGKKASSEEN